MTVRLATWNINSVRHREAAVLRLLREEAPDVLCLQETKTPVEKLPLDGLRALGYRHVVARGQKAYNGVAILSRLPLEESRTATSAPAATPATSRPACRPARSVHNLYIPAGGDLPDPALNPKFAHKLDFLAELRAWFAATPARARHPRRRPQRRPARGRRLEPPRLLRVVSHTPVEVEAFTAARRGRRLGRRDPRPPARRPALFLVVLPRPRLAGRRQGPPPRPRLGHPRPRRTLRRQPHRPPRPRLGDARATTSRSSPSSRHDRSRDSIGRDRPRHPRPPRGAQRARPGRHGDAHRAPRRLGRPRRPARPRPHRPRPQLLRRRRPRRRRRRRLVRQPADPALRRARGLPAPRPSPRLNGGAYGGGVELALACDFRVGVTCMRAFVPPARLGIHYEPAGIAAPSTASARRPPAASSSSPRPSTPRRSSPSASSITWSRRMPSTPRWPSSPTPRRLAPLAVRGMKRTILELDRRTASTRDAARHTHRRLLRLRRPRRRPRRPARTPRAAFHRPLNALPCKASDLPSEDSEIDRRSIRYVPLVSRAFYGRRLSGSDLAPPALHD